MLNLIIREDHSEIGVTEDDYSRIYRFKDYLFLIISLLMRWLFKEIIFQGLSNFYFNRYGQIIKNKRHFVTNPCITKFNNIFLKLCTTLYSYFHWNERKNMNFILYNNFELLITKFEEQNLFIQIGKYHF